MLLCVSWSLPIDDCVVWSTSKPGGLSEVDEVEEADEWIDDADEPHCVAELPYCDRFLFTSLVMNNAAASISSLIVWSPWWFWCSGVSLVVPQNQRNLGDLIIRLFNNLL